MKKDYDSTRIYRNTHKKRVRHRLMTHPHKKNKKNIDMVTEMVTLFIYMFDEDFLYATLFYTQLGGVI